MRPGAELFAIALRVHAAYQGGSSAPIWNDVRTLAKEVIEMANPDDDDVKALAAFAELVEARRLFNASSKAYVEIEHALDRARDDLVGADARVEAAEAQLRSLIEGRSPSQVGDDVERAIESALENSRTMRSRR